MTMDVRDSRYFEMRIREVAKSMMKASGKEFVHVTDILRHFNLPSGGDSHRAIAAALDKMGIKRRTAARGKVISHSDSSAFKPYAIWIDPEGVFEHDAI